MQLPQRFRAIQGICPPQRGAADRRARPIRAAENVRQVLLRRRYIEQPLRQRVAKFHLAARPGLAGSKHELARQVGVTDADAGRGVAADLVQHTLHRGVLRNIVDARAVDLQVVEPLALGVDAIIGVLVGIFLDKIALSIGIKGAYPSPLDFFAVLGHDTPVVVGTVINAAAQLEFVPVLVEVPLRGIAVKRPLDTRVFVEPFRAQHVAKLLAGVEVVGYARLADAKFASRRGGALQCGAGALGHIKLEAAGIRHADGDPVRAELLVDGGLQIVLQRGGHGRV